MGELGCNWEGPLHPPGLQDEVKAREGSEYQRGAGMEGHGEGPWQWSHVSYVELQERWPTFLPLHQTPHNWKMGLESRWTWSLTSRSSSDTMCECVPCVL